VEISDVAPASPDNAGVAVYPPVYYAVPLAIGLALDRAAPVPGARDSATRGRAIGVASIVAAIGIIVLAVGAIRNAGSDISSKRPTTELVEGGVFAVTRNPMYVALTAAYIGAALLGRSRLALVLLPVVLAQLDRHEVDREELYLERTFGDRYRAYCALVPRWF